MSFPFVWSSIGLRPAIARSTSLDTVQFLRHRPFSTIYRQPLSLHLRRVYVPKTWILNRLGTGHAGLRTLHGLLTATGMALGIATCTAHTIHCDSQGSASPLPTLSSQAPPPESGVDLYELRFDRLLGICLGFLVKQGVRMLKLFLGPVFVLLQVLNPMSLVRIDWDSGVVQVENPLYTKDELGNKSAPTISSMRKWAVDFFSAEFQPKSFNDGVKAGLRVD